MPFSNDLLTESPQTGLFRNWRAVWTASEPEQMVNERIGTYSVNESFRQFPARIARSFADKMLCSEEVLLTAEIC